MTAQAKQHQPMPDMCEVVLRISGVDHILVMPPDGDSIVATALDQGIDAPSACLEGICSSCKARVLAGGVTMGDALALDDQDRAAGWVLGCQSRPATCRVILSFDDI